jgi:hypothetical protein
MAKSGQAARFCGVLVLYRRNRYGARIRWRTYYKPGTISVSYTGVALQN